MIGEQPLSAGYEAVVLDGSSPQLAIIIILDAYELPSLLDSQI